MKDTFIIAEAGVNHNGELNLAFDLIDAAKEARVDAVKFQTYRTENLVTKTAVQAEYQKQNIGSTSSQYEMLKKLELSYDDFRQLKNHCDKNNILFLSTPFDIESADFLIKDLELPLMKIPSGEITNAPYLYNIAKYDVEVILSTGMATIEEIHHALAFIAYGYSQNESVSFEAVKNFYKTEQAQEVIRDKVSILHCTSEYPTPIKEVHLNTMNHLSEEFHLPIGLSDHSEGILASVVAVGMGAKIIEKHFTLDKKMEGPDHKASLNPSELKEFVQSIRMVEEMLGNDKKEPVEIELKNRSIARKSLVAANEITKGEYFTTDNLTIKRPGTGIEPYYYWDYLGSKSDKKYKIDEVIK